MKNVNNQNNFNETININGSVQVAGGNIINGNSEPNRYEENYTPEPKWRSPLTLAVLTWISVIISILGLFPLSKILTNAINILKGKPQATLNLPLQTYSIIFFILVLLFILFSSLRRITKKQIRVPLILNYAISGYGERIILEKIHIGPCPQCGGKMKYYNKPVEWINIHYGDGRTKRKVTKRIPVIECMRNSEHCYKIDPAEDKIK